MSLNPDDSRRRGRSKSPGGRGDRDRSQADERRGSTRVKAPSPPSSRYADDDDDDDGGGRDRDRYEYEERTSTVKTTRNDRDDRRYSRDDRSSPPRRPSYAVPGGFSRTEEEDVKVRYSDGREKDYYEEKKYKTEYVPEPTKRRPSRYDDPDPRDSRRYADDRQSFSISGGVKISHDRDESPERRPSPPKRRSSPPKRRSSPPARSPSPPARSPSPPARSPSPPARRSSPPTESSASVTITAGRSKYAEPKKWEYAQPEETITYTRRESTNTTAYAVPASSQAAQIITVEPGRRRPSGTDSVDRRMSSLTVATTTGAATSLALAPGSPLLEAYRGTYQSISPMPSPMMVTSGARVDYDVNVLDISSSTRQRHARFHDPVADAYTLSRALKGTKPPETGPLIEILPALTHEQMMQLRVEYKRIVKTGSEKKGVNIAKHIKMRLKEETPSLMKACYATALGRWESEAYWANFWYQGEKSRRELLIESLMGRTNTEIRAIKDGFNDKKYSDSLTKCMKQELKEDKFKQAVLLVLEERRMEERPGYSLNRSQVEDDVRQLYKFVRPDYKGGETAMIGIIVLRSDSHLREILRVYEASFRSNFVRDMLKKSGNLVGELLTHILNGVINRPVRDAQLLHHALSLTKGDGLRTELLISRLVRYHWDRPHMEAVKKEYLARYGRNLQQAVSDGTKGLWGDFCEELCVRRMGDDVRRVEIIEGEYRLAGSS